MNNVVRQRVGWPLAFVSKMVVLVVLGIGMMLATWLMDRASIRVQLDTYIFSYGFFVNALPVILVFLLLLVLCNRALLSVILTMALVATIYIANSMKMQYLDTPVSFSDVYLLGNLHASTLELLSNYVNGWYFAGGLAALIGLFVLSFWLEPKFFRRRSVPRALVAVLVLAGMVSIASGARWVGHVYGSKNLRVVAWAPMLTILHSGLLSSITYTSAERARALDVPVNQHDVDAFMQLDTGPAFPVQQVGARKPDIIVIQSESFFDPGILKPIDNTDATLPNVHRAQASGIGGSMKAPTFGGGTLRTEFEVLTGIPMDAYPTIEFPYLQITQPVIPSIIGVAHDDGYRTIAIHGNDGKFWDRDKAFKAIGFDQFVTAEDFPKNAAREGWYYADSAMTEQIIAKLDQAEKSSQPTMIFAISIEAHGPYQNVPVGDAARRDAIAVPSQLSSRGAREFRNYLYHIEDADRQAARLWNYLARRKRPFILAFYGDHLPGLQHVYKATGFDDGRSGPQQSVPWFIVGSDITHQSRHIKAWMLGSEILRAAGITPTRYYQLIGKAERGLQGKPDATRRDVILQGINSLARLYLRGKLAQDLPTPTSSEAKADAPRP